MKKRILAVFVIFAMLSALSVTVVFGGPGSSNPPIELKPTSAPIILPEMEE
ncbi:MAG: hypothetical protein FWE33_04260 [Defluviitaleaceae bacterium]|nr:hypothetical protein [Defluviitaleaceae bacterium]